MARANETPRQKMIAMMYIVMVALLALNVSRDFYFKNNHPLYFRKRKINPPLARVCDPCLAL